MKKREKASSSAEFEFREELCIQIFAAKKQCQHPRHKENFVKMVEETSKKENDVKFPEFPDLKKEQIEGMSHEEKLKLIDREAQTLYDFCLEKGLSQKELSWCIKPLFGSPPEYVKKVVKDNSKFCLTLAVIFGLIAVFAGWNPAYNQLTVHGKLALMKVSQFS